MNEKQKTALAKFEELVEWEEPLNLSHRSARIAHARIRIRIRDMREELIDDYIRTLEFQMEQRFLEKIGTGL